MGPPSLDDIDLRIARAKDQLALLDDEVREFAKTKRGTIVGEFDPMPASTSFA